MDYYTNRDNNPNCYYNPDYKLNVTEIIKRNGYPVETHYATTNDGYILTVYRIPHGLDNKKVIQQPILLTHGITMNSGSFVLSGKRSLAFMLADAGYDVWLGNFRGSRYSNNHTTLDVQSATFWNFSMHELGVYDVPALTKFVIEKTNKKIIYIGFSLGAVAGYIYGSTYSKLASEEIEYFIAIGPGVFLQNSVLRIIDFVWPLLRLVLNCFTEGSLYVRPPLPIFLYKLICFPLPIQMNICQILDMVMLGYNYEQNNPETLPVTLLYNIDRTTIKMLDHFLQILRSGNFQHYDYNEEQNKILYGNIVPPLYNLSNVRFDNYIVYSGNDKIAHDETINMLYTQLPNETYSKAVYKIKNAKINHIDILVGKNADLFVYTPIIEELKRREQKYVHKYNCNV